MNNNTATDDTRLDNALRDLILQRKFSSMDLRDQLVFFCQTIAETVRVQRVSVWMLNKEHTELTSSVEWDQSKKVIQSGSILARTEAPAYFDAICRDAVIAIDDCATDPRSAELQDSYMARFGVVSLLDCPLHDSGGMVGMLCVENTDPQKRWTPHERNFVVAVSSLVSMVFETRARKDAEFKAADRDQRIFELAEMHVGWMWETNPQLELVRVVGNRTVAGQDAGTLMGRKPWELPWINPLDTNWPDIKALMYNHQPFHDLIFYYQMPERKRSYVEVSARPHFDKDGVFVGYIGVTKNVTDRMHREADLRASEQRYRNASKLARFGHWIWDREQRRCVFCSPELAAVFGLTVEEYLARSSSTDNDVSLYHPDDRDRFRRITAQAEANKSGWQISVRILRDDGQIRHVRQWTEAILDAEGRATSTLGVLLDITEQVEMESTLQESQARLANIVDNLPGAVFRVKCEENWPAVYRSKGYYRHFVDPSSSGGDWSGSNQAWMMRVEEHDRMRIQKTVAQAVREMHPYEIEYKITTIHGDTKWVWERGRPVVTPGGEIEVEGMLIDTTDKRNAEDALIKAQRGEAIGQMTGGVAHDFNNLLAVIMGNLELLREDIDDADQLQMIDAGIEASLRGADLTASMLAFARQARLTPAKMDLNEVVERAQKWIARTLPTSIELVFHPAENLWPVDADIASTESALLNLILNARDAMKDAGGKLTVETSNILIDKDNIQSSHDNITGGRYVMLAVSDTGEGIRPENQSRIFEPFFTTKGPGAGSGLGLAMVDGFMQQSGGAVRVYSEHGVGTTFKLYFKAAIRDTQSFLSQNADNSNKPLETGKILIAEDEKGVLDILVTILRLAGHEVVAAASGVSAKAAFDASPDFDLLITDIVMPGGLLGPDLAQALREQRPDLPVIFLTGYASEAVTHGTGVRAEDIRLMKPIRRSDLLARIQQVLKRVRKT